MSAQASAQHPHEPEIPPALDAEGRCHICSWLAWSDGRYPDDSPGDVIHAEADGTITLDDGITTWNPLRALAWFAGGAEGEHGRMKYVAFLVLWLAFVWAFGRAIDAQAHNVPGSRHNIRHAINLAWCGRANSYCAAGKEAWQVAGCETGYTYSVWARNGQYEGLFQMGAYARARYGHSWNPWGQARAAHRYYRAAGWGPWECRP